jgi:hypothetical protein
MENKYDNHLKPPSVEGIEKARKDYAESIKDVVPTKEIKLVEVTKEKNGILWNEDIELEVGQELHEALLRICGYTATEFEMQRILEAVKKDNNIKQSHNK